LGGGLFNNGGSVTITGSTLSGNSAQGGAGGAGSFGFGNGAAGSGAGGGAFNLGGTLNLRNTIIAGNLAATAPDLLGLVASQGHNLIGNTSGASGFVGSDLLNQNPLLGPLQNNGGPTQTMALLPGSPAVDAGDNSNAPATDQRGLPRIVGGVIDIGAFEVQIGPATHFSVSAPSSTTAGAVFSATVTARDAYNHPANATVHFTSSDRQAVLPADATITNGSGVFSVILRTAGNQTITATDLADNTVTASATVTVNPAPTTTALTSSANPAVFGQTVTITATVTPVPPGTGTTPTGTVTFTVDGALVTAVLLAGGRATLALSSLAPGNHNIQAMYSGDTTFSGSVGSLALLVVNPAPALTAIDPAAVVEGGPSFILTVHGVNFIPSSTVQANGITLVTTFVSNTVLQIQVPAALLVEENVLGITVATPGPGGGASSALSLTIADAPLTAHSIQVTTAQGVAFTGLVATFTDANAGAPVADFTATIIWGDGHVSPGAIAPAANGGFQVFGTNVYLQQGTFAIGVQIADRGGSQALASSQAIVVAPQSFATQTCTPGSPVIAVGVTGVQAALVQTPPDNCRTTVSVANIATIQQNTVTIQRGNGITDNFQLVVSMNVRLFDVRVTDVASDGTLALVFQFPDNVSTVPTLSFLSDLATGTMLPVQGSTRLPGSFIVDLVHHQFRVILDDTSVPSVNNLTGTEFAVSFITTTVVPGTISSQVAQAGTAGSSQVATDVTAQAPAAKPFVNSTALTLIVSASTSSQVTTSATPPGGGGGSLNESPPEDIDLAQLLKVLGKMFEALQKWQQMMTLPMKDPVAPTQQTAPEARERTPSAEDVHVSPNRLTTSPFLDFGTDSLADALWHGHSCPCGGQECPLHKTAFAEPGWMREDAGMSEVDRWWPLVGGLMGAAYLEAPPRQGRKSCTLPLERVRALTLN
jgi:hypothetical protein